MRFSHFLGTLIFDAILVQHASTFVPKTHQNRFKKLIVKGINFLIDSCIDFLLILARLWKPTWRHVGNMFGQNGGTLWCLPLFLLRSMFLFEFLAVLTPLLRKMSRAATRFWRVLGSILECFGFHFGSFWWLFVRFSVSIFFTIFKFNFLNLRASRETSKNELRRDSGWPQNLEYQAARKLWMSSSPKSLNIEQPKNFEYRAARKVWISSGPKTLNIERSEKFEYRAARQHWTSISSEMFEYRATL